MSAADLWAVDAVPLPVVDATAIPAPDDLAEVTAEADPENAHSPMSPEDRVSNQHPGLHEEEHSTGGATPAS